jgi:uncharacterized protein YdiU (UPF0061 family)
MLKKVMEENNLDWENVYYKHKDKDMTRAKKRANRKILSDDVDSFRNLYSNFLAEIFKYSKSKLHRGIVDSINDLVYEEIPIEKAIEKTLDENTSEITSLIKLYRRKFEDSDDESEENP